MKEQPQRRGTGHPEGGWGWKKGPSWWRDMPAVHDVDCKWRILLIERVVPLEEVS